MTNKSASTGDLWLRLRLALRRRRRAAHRRNASRKALHRRPGSIAAILLLALVLAAVTGLLEEILRQVIQSQGSRVLQAEVTLDSLDIDILPPALGFKGLRIDQPAPYQPPDVPRDPNSPSHIEVLSIESFRLSLLPTNLLKEIRIGHGRLEGTQVNIRLKEGLPVDLPGLVGLLTGKPPPEGTPTPGAVVEEGAAIEIPDLHLGRLEVIDLGGQVSSLDEGWSFSLETLGVELGFQDQFALESGRVTLSSGRADIGDIHESLRGVVLEVEGEEGGRRLKIKTLKAGGDGIDLGASGWVRLPEDLLNPEKPKAKPPSPKGAPPLELDEDPLAFLQGWVGRLTLNLGLSLPVVNRLVPDAPPLEGAIGLQADIGVDGPQVYGEGTLTLKGTALTLDSTHLVIGDGVLPIQGNREKIEVQGGLLKAGGGDLSVNAVMALGEGFPVEASLGLQGVELGNLLRDLSLAGSWVTTVIDGEIALGGSISPFELAGDADLRLNQFKVLADSFENPDAYLDPMLAIDSFTVQGPLSLNDSAVWLDQALISSPKNRIFADVYFGFDLSMDIGLEVSALDLGELSPIAGLDILGDGWGQARVWGPLSDLMIAAQVSLIGAEVDFLDLGDIDGTILVPLNTMSFVEQLEADLEEGDVSPLLGAFNPGLASLRRLAASTRAINQTYYDGVYDTGNELAVMFVQGVTGRVGETPYSGDVGIFFGEPLILGVDVDIEGGEVADILHVLELEVGEGRPLRGELSGRVRLSGPPEALNGTLEDVLISPGVAYGEVFERLEVDGRMDGGDIYIDRALMDNGDGRILGAGSLAMDGAVALTLKVQGLPLMDLDALVEADLPVTGVINADVSVLGSLDALMIQGQVEVLGVAYATLDLGELTLGLQTLDSTLLLEGQLGDMVTLGGEIGLSGVMPLVALVQVQGLPLDPFLDLNSKGQRVSSGVGFSLQARGDLAPEVGEAPIFMDARLDELFIERGRLRVQNYGPARVRIRGDDIDIRGLELVGPGTDLGISGGVGAKGALDLRGEGTLNLALLDVLIRDVFQRVEGQLTGPEGGADLHLTGTVDAPLLNGRARIENMAVRAEAFPQTVDSIEVDITLRDNIVSLDNAEASMGGGKIDGGGELRLGRDLLPYFYDLSFGVDEVVIRYPDYLPAAEVHGNLVLQGEGTGLLMGGDLIIDRAVYRERINWEKDLLTFRPNRLDSIALIEEDPPLMGFAIQIRADETLYMRNNVGNLQMSCDILLEGDTNLMGVTGGVTVNRGKVYLLNTELDMVEGEISFLDYRTFNPYLDLALETEVQTYTISYQVLGTWEDYQISSSSDAGLSERDINSLLAFGVLADDLSGSSATAVAQPALEFLAGSLGLQQQVEGVVPIDLDRFGVVPVLDSSGSTSVRFYGEKELQEDKISTSFHYDVGVNQDYKFQLEYKVSDTFSIVGDADQGRQFNARLVPNVGGRMKFRWEF